MARKCSGVYVKVRNDDLDSALRIFSKKIKDSKLIIRIKENGYYEKPSIIKRRKRMAAILRSRHRHIEED